MRGGLLLAAIGAALWAVGLVLEPRRALAGYLAAYVAVLWPALGALLLGFAVPLGGGRWFEHYRAEADRLVRLLPLLALGVLPLALGAAVLYPWAATPGERAAYLNLPFFLVRAAVCLGAWAALAWLATRMTGRHRARIRRRRRVALLGLPILALTMTFAAFDWVMSLQPTFASAIFGVYLAAGGVVAAMGAVALLDHRDARRGATPPSARRAFGALWLGLLLVWFYAGYSQYLLAWFADLPAEAAWYLPRSEGSWGAVGLVVLFLQFVVPATLLLLPEIRQRTRVLAVLGLLTLLARWLDAAWLVLPSVDPAGLRPHPADPGALALLAGLALATDARRPRDERAAPRATPPAEPTAVVGAA